MPATEDRLLDEPPFRVGPHRVRPALLEVETGGAVQTMEPKVMGVLCHLARRAGEPVSRRDLMAEGWPDTVVGDEVLTRCVSELRKAFGDNARAPTVIGTVSRVGYRLLAPVDRGEEDRPAPAAPGVATPPATPVLPPPDAAPAFPDTAPAAAPAGMDRSLWATAMLGVLAAAALLVAAGYALAGQGGAESPAAPLTARPLTSAPGIEMEPALSPDGRRVAYAVHTDSTTVLVVGPADRSSEPLRIAEAPLALQSPRWHPGGDRLAYVAQGGGRCMLREVSALGGPERAIGPCPDGRTRSIDWTADGQALLSGGHEDGAGMLSLVDLQTGHVLPLPYDHPPGAVDAMPRAAPDGERVLFRRTVGDEVASVCVLDLATGAVTTLATETAMLIGLDWLPDGGVVYGSVQVGETTLYRLASAAGGAEPIPFPVSGAGMIARLDVAGGALVFERWDVEIGLFSFSLARPGVLTPFAPSTVFDAYPQIAPDGRRVAFVSERSGTPQVWVAERDGSRARQATSLPGVAYSAPRWSPDGQRLAFAATDEAGADLYVIDREGAAPRRLPRPGSNEVHPAWSADGRWVYASSDRSGQPEIWRFPASGDGGEALSTGGALLARPAPDGRYLYLMRPGRPGLWRRSGERGSDAPHVPGLRALDKDNWVPTANGVVWVDTGQRVDALRASRSEAPLFTFPADGEVYALDWDEASQSGIVAHMGEREADLGIAELPLWLAGPVP